MEGFLFFICIIVSLILFKVNGIAVDVKNIRGELRRQRR